MKFRHVTDAPTAVQADLLAVAVYQDAASDPAFKALDSALEGRASEQAAAEKFTGKAGQTLLVAGADLPARRVLVLGAGDRSEFQPTSCRDLAAQAIKTAMRTGSRTVCIAGPTLTAKHHEAQVQHAVEGAVLGTYRFRRYLSEDPDAGREVTEVILAPDPRGKTKGSAGRTRALNAAVERGQAVADGICVARDLINEPAAYMTPAQMAAEARKLGKRRGVTVKVLSRKECEKLGMGMFLAVSQGSEQEPKFIHITYAPSKKPKKRIAIIGKGVTFDSGGYSIKPSTAMEDMKLDMSGAAAVIGAMGAIARIGSEYEIHAIAACCENLISGRAYKLGDVLTSMDGTTVEINNTDAEGRLTMGDALTYARTKIEPDEMFDLATLTGACMIALGPHTAAVMSGDDKLAQRWLAAAEAAGESMWRMPLEKKLRKQLDSPIADMRNTGERYGGAITAGLFLQTFVKDVPWVHIDIAGPAFTGGETPTTTRGGTGFGVATLVEYLTH
jgi:leucyl aminopeptidase